MVTHMSASTGASNRASIDTCSYLRGLWMCLLCVSVKQCSVYGVDCGCEVRHENTATTARPSESMDYLAAPQLVCSFNYSKAFMSSYMHPLHISSRRDPSVPRRLDVRWFVGQRLQTSPPEVRKYTNCWCIRCFMDFEVLSQLRR